MLGKGFEIVKVSHITLIGLQGNSTIHSNDITCVVNRAIVENIMLNIINHDIFSAILCALCFRFDISVSCNSILTNLTGCFVINSVVEIIGTGICSASFSTQSNATIVTQKVCIVVIENNALGADKVDIPTSRLHNTIIDYVIGSKNINITATWFNICSVANIICSLNHNITSGGNYIRCCQAAHGDITLFVNELNAIPCLQGTDNPQIITDFITSNIVVIMYH